VGEVKKCKNTQQKIEENLIFTLGQGNDEVNNPWPLLAHPRINVKFSLYFVPH